MATTRTARRFSYKMGTNNAKLLLKGAKKVPKGTLFFIGENGQLYMRSGPYLEGDGQVHVRAGLKRSLASLRGRPGERRDP